MYLRERYHYIPGHAGPRKLEFVISVGQRFNHPSVEVKAELFNLVFDDIAYEKPYLKLGGDETNMCLKHPSFITSLLSCYLFDSH